MIIKPNKRDGWEEVDLVVKNGTAALVNIGTPLFWDIETGKDGSVVLATAANIACKAGIALEQFGTSGQYDDVKTVRAYGWHSAILVAGTTFHPGAMLAAAAAATYLTLAITHATTLLVGTHTERQVMAYGGTTGCLIATSTVSTAYTYPGFVRCLG